MTILIAPPNILDRFEYGPFNRPYLAAYLDSLPPHDPAWLRDLPCPVLGIGDPDHPAAQHFDIIAPRAENLAGIVKNIAAAPIAAATLVQTLRAAEHLAIADALAVESLAYATLQGGAENRAWLARRPPPPASPHDPAPALLLERNNAALTLVLNRPSAFNAVNITLRDALAEALALAALDTSVHEIHLRANGRCFSIGGALEEFGTAPDQATAHAVRCSTGPAFRLAVVAAQTTAHVHGACIGAGLELAALCGKIVASPDAFFQLPEIRFGLMPGSGGTVGLARRIGRQRAAYMALSARRISVGRALEWGLIDQVKEREALLF